MAGSKTLRCHTHEGVPSGIIAQQSSCITISDNHLYNVFNGVRFGGDQKGNNGKYSLIRGNSIDNFSGDGIDHYGSHVRIENNRITDGHDVCNNQCVHNDGIQGWNYNHLPIENTDVTIDGNEIIAQTAPRSGHARRYTPRHYDFDGTWDNVRIFNNLVIVDAWHGITVGGGHNVSIVNNTVVPTNSSRGTWIAYSGRKRHAAGNELQYCHSQ